MTTPVKYLFDWLDQHSFGTSNPVPRPYSCDKCLTLRVQEPYSLEISNQNIKLFEQFNIYFTEVYGHQFPKLKFEGYSEDEDDEDVDGTKLKHFIAPGKRYEINLMDTRDGTILGWDKSRHDLNPFFFGSMQDLKVTIEVKEETANPVGLSYQFEVYRRLILSGHRETLEALCRMCHKYFQHPEASDGFISIYKNYKSGYWSRPYHIAKRPLNTVYLDEGVREKVTHELEHFYSSKHLYRKFSIPYRHHILLAGPPGTGKTSLIRALASELDKDIGLIRFSPLFGLEELETALSTFPGDFLVIEDVDSLYVGRKQTQGISFSDFINTVDGICSQEGIVLLMTSNHPELLDPAMIRPGRVDSLIMLGHITKSQLNDMFLSYFPDQMTQFETFYDQLIQRMGEGRLSTARMQRFFFSHLGCKDICQFMDEWTPELEEDMDTNDTSDSDNANDTSNSDDVKDT